MPPRKLFIALLFIELKQTIKFGRIIKPKDAHKHCKFGKNPARDPSLKSNYILNFEGLGAVYPHPGTDQGEIWNGGGACKISP